MPGHDDRLVIVAIVSLLIGVFIPVILPAFLQVYLIYLIWAICGVALISVIYRYFAQRGKR